MVIPLTAKGPCVFSSRNGYIVYIRKYVFKRSSPF